MAAATKTKTTKTTKATSTKKTATGTETTMDSIFDAMGTAQDQYFTMLERSQKLALDGFSSIIGAVPAIPTIPVLDGFVPADMANITSEGVDAAFDFAGKLLDNQREFATKLVAASTN